MGRKNKDIKDQYHFFEELINGEKIILDDEITLKPKKNNAFWLTGKSNAQHTTISDEIHFIVDQSRRDNKYGLKLRCSSFTDEPFFRFDSDGPAHRNENPDTPLEEQLIKTPHFNSFDENGKSIAYKNETLKDEKKAQIIVDDINFGVSLFCMETNSKRKDGNFPTVIDLIPEFDFSEKNNINFDNINFD